MTTQAQTKHTQGNSQMELLKHSSEQVKLFSIAVQMKKAGLVDTFIVNAVQTALEFDGVADLMQLWAGETDTTEKEEIIADIQDMTDTCTQR